MKLSDRCFAITGLGYAPPWYVNAGFVAGTHTTLIVDTGGNAAAAATIYGYASTVAPANRLRVINTEKHFDHIGGNSFFREKNIDIWGHNGISRTSAQFQAEIAEFNDAIPNQVRRRYREANSFFEGTRLTNPNCRLWSDMDWDLGGISVHVLLTPGHTPTNLSVWVPAEGVLYTGDCLIRSFLPNLEAGGPEDWRHWLASLERIKGLGARTVVCGHGPVSSGDDVPRIIGEVERVLRQALDQGHAPTL